MIEFIKSLFEIGDHIYIYKDRGEVNGRILNINENFIALETDDGNIVGIRKTAIESFSKEPLQKSQHQHRKGRPNGGQRYSNGKYYNNHTSNHWDNRNEFREYKAGDQIPREFLAKRDPSLTSSWKKMEEARRLSSEVREEMKAAYEEVVESNRTEDQEIVPAHGLIVSLKPSFQFGFIDDMHTGARYFFNKGDIIDPELKEMSGDGIEVVYQRANNHKGPAAKCVHAPRSVAELLEFFMNLIQEDDYQRAKMLIENILFPFPNNQSAKELLEKLEEALNKQGQDISNRGDAIYSIARKALESKDYDKALKHYYQCLEKGIRKVNAIKEIAQVYISLHAQEKDETYKEEIRQRGLDFIEEYKSELPEGQSTRFSLENIYFALGDYESHIDVVEDIIQTCGRQGELGQYVFYLNKAAQSYMRLQDYERALDAADQGLEVEPDNIHLLKTRTTIEEASNSATYGEDSTAGYVD